jgi:EmrB/QacA subfamily drug resistance transporter
MRGTSVPVSTWPLSCAAKFADYAERQAWHSRPVRGTEDVVGRIASGRFSEGVDDPAEERRWSISVDSSLATPAGLRARSPFEEERCAVAAHASEPSLEELDPALQLPYRRKMEILLAVLLVVFLSALDQTIVGVALPRIVGELGGTNELYTWVITSYLLTATITGVFYGKLSDIFGRRLMLLLGVSVFLIGSALCGLSWNIESLVIFRGVQGVGAGAIFPVSLAVIGDLFGPRERGRYQGLFGAVFGIASVLGPLLGGWLTEGFGWHWVFFVNLPLGVLTIYIVWRYLPSVHGERPTRDLDYLGALVFAVAVVFLLLGLTNKQGGAWTDANVGGFILIALLLTPVFLWIESRAAEPIVPLELFRIRNYSVTILATFLTAVAFFGAIIFLPRWFQFVEEVSPTESGLYLLPLMGGVIISSVGSGIIVSRTGRFKWLVIGALVVLAVGLYLMTGLQATTEMPGLWALMFVVGLGVGPTLSIFTIIVQASVPFSRLGVATGNLTFFRQVGASVGLAVVGTVFADAFSERLRPELEAAGLPEQSAGMVAEFALSGGADLTQVTDVSLADQLAQVPALAGIVDQVVAGIYQAFSLAIGDTFWIGLAVTLVALVVAAIGLQNRPIRSLRDEGGEGPGRSGPAQRSVPPS